MKELLRDIGTVPNALTIGRLLTSPFVANRLEDDPAFYWAPTAVFLASDNLDEFLAKLGEKHPSVEKYGLRKSEFGRKADPFTDKIVSAQMLRAGMRNGAIPKPLGYAAIAQKAVMSARALYASAIGCDLHVTNLGRHSEGLQNLGFGTLCAAEAVADSIDRHDLKLAAGAIAMVGIVGSALADNSYAQEIAVYKSNR